MSSADQQSPELPPSSELTSDDTTSEPSSKLKRPPARPTLMSPPKRPAEPKPAPQPPVSAEPVQVSPAQPTPSEVATEAEDPSSSLVRNHPISPPSEPMQYRAIGLVRGVYAPSEEQFNRGALVTPDETLVDAVLLGRVTSLVKKHLDLTVPHLWVVYPRTRDGIEGEQEAGLHLQIVGVWEPETLGLPGQLPDSDTDVEGEVQVEGSLEGEPQADTEADAEAKADKPMAATQPQITSEDVEDGYFSIRGEVIEYSEEIQRIDIKIQQGAKQPSKAPRAFKLCIEGTLSGRTIGYFWDLQVQRQGAKLVLTGAKSIGAVPPKKKPPRDKRSSRPPFKGRKPSPRPTPSDRRPAPSKAAE